MDDVTEAEIAAILGDHKLPARFLFQALSSLATQYAIDSLVEHKRHPSPSGLAEHFGELLDLSTAERNALRAFFTDARVDEYVHLVN